MTDQPQRTEAPLRIQTPCPKSWSELAGDGPKRFCAACCLHVHDAAQLTRAEAHALVANTSERVCMRVVLDPQGAPLFRDSRALVPAEAPPRPLARLAHWALSTAAGVLAACHGSTAPASTSASGSGGHPPPADPSACTTELLGGVAAPSDELPERMGEATVTTDPVPAVPLAPQPEK